MRLFSYQFICWLVLRTGVMEDIGLSFARQNLWFLGHRKFNIWYEAWASKKGVWILITSIDVVCKYQGDKGNQLRDCYMEDRNRSTPSSGIGVFLRGSGWKRTYEPLVIWSVDYGEVLLIRLQNIFYESAQLEL